MSFPVWAPSLIRGKALWDAPARWDKLTTLPDPSPRPPGGFTEDRALRIFRALWNRFCKNATSRWSCRFPDREGRRGRPRLSSLAASPCPQNHVSPKPELIAHGAQSRVTAAAERGKRKGDGAFANDLPGLCGFPRPTMCFRPISWRISSAGDYPIKGKKRFS